MEQMHPPTKRYSPPCADWASMASNLAQNPPLPVRERAGVRVSAGNNDLSPYLSPKGRLNIAHG